MSETAPPQSEITQMSNIENVKDIVEKEKQQRKDSGIGGTRWILDFYFKIFEFSQDCEKLHFDQFNIHIFF